jgi:uncharacterized protein (DUF1810 family)
MTEADRFDLDRFITAQEPVFETVLAELRAGRKRTHWMWFIFPQLAGLGRSSTARFYGIGSVDEVRAYLAHPVLGPRLDLCTRIVLASESPSVHAIFGSPDDQIPGLHDAILAGGGRPGQSVPPGSRSLVRRPAGRANTGACRLNRSISAVVDRPTLTMAGHR